MTVVISASINSFIYLTVMAVILTRLVNVTLWKKGLVALLGAPEVLFYVRWMFLNNSSTRKTYLIAQYFSYITLLIAGAYEFTELTIDYFAYNSTETTNLAIVGTSFLVFGFLSLLLIQSF